MRPTGKVMGNRMEPGLFLIALSLHGQSLGIFSEAGNLTTEREAHTATLLNNGKVLIAGGYAVLAGYPVWSSAELYDPASHTFSATGDMTTPRYGHTATLLPDGRVLITGGASSINFDISSYPSQASAELYDPSSGTFTAAGSMTVARISHSATLLNNGEVLIVGGVDAQGQTTELYDPVKGAFSATGSMRANGGGHIATLLSNGKVLVEGGDYCHLASNPELYDPATGTFSLTGDSPEPHLSPTTGNLLLNGNVLTMLNEFCDIANGAELYDSNAGNFSAITDLPAESGASATLLPDGKVFLHWQPADPTARPGGTSVLYDPIAATFTTLQGEYPQSDQGHTSTLLPDGSVLLAGGWICCEYTAANAEIYAPAVLIPSPILYSIPRGKQGAILHGATQQIVSTSNPAVAGEALEIYGTGLIEGSVIPPQVSIGGLMAEVLFFGDAPGYQGLNQINIRMPSGLSLGAAVSVRMNYLARPSNEVTIAVK